MSEPIIAVKKKFTYTINHPLESKMIEKGAITQDEFMAIARTFPWEDLLLKQNTAKDKEIHFSPSLNLTNEDGIAISVSIVGAVDDHEYYVCYNRPIWIKKRKWFRTVEVFDFFCSVVPGQSLEDAFEAFELLFMGDLDKLEERWQGEPV